MSRLYKFFICYVLKKKHYNQIAPGILFTNWIFQRILRNNYDVPISVYYTSYIFGFNNIKFPKDSESILTSFAVSGGCHFGISPGTTLEIGENTIWAFDVCIQTCNHDLLDRSKYTLASVKIGKNVWIGNGVTILPGVEIGDNVTIGANSVVTKSFGSNLVIAGVPAKIIKEL